jgi:hypothetical protein
LKQAPREALNACPSKSQPLTGLLGLASAVSISTGTATSPPINTTAVARKIIASTVLFASVFCCMKLEEVTASYYPFNVKKQEKRKEKIKEE